MKQLQTDPFQEQLLTLREALLAQIAQQRGGVVGRAEVAAAHFGHPENSSAQLATERELEFALGEHETAELLAIDNALQRIEVGTYGECTDCGDHIPQARLHAAPQTHRCITCQEKAEHHRPA